jgi:hypothetical protein
MKLAFFLLLSSILQSAHASPFLPSQGDLTVQDDCADTTLRAGETVTISADKNGVTLTAKGQTIAIASSDARGSGSASVVGHFCGMQKDDDMCTIGLGGQSPILIGDELVYNGFSTMGGMGVGDPLPAGFLVDASRTMYDLQLFDNGNGIELSAISFPTTQKPDPSSTTSGEAVIRNCVLSK